MRMFWVKMRRLPVIRVFKGHAHINGSLRLELLVRETIWNEEAPSLLQQRQGSAAKRAIGFYSSQSAETQSGANSVTNYLRMNFISTTLDFALKEITCPAPNIQ